MFEFIQGVIASVTAIILVVISPAYAPPQPTLTPTAQIETIESAVFSTPSPSPTSTPTVKPKQEVKAVSTIPTAPISTLAPSSTPTTQIIESKQPSLIPVYLPSLSTTVTCQPESINAVQSADNSRQHAVDQYNNCYAKVSTGHLDCAVFGASHYINDDQGYSEWIKKCDYYYDYKSCPSIIPYDEALLNLTNQYCQ